MTKLTLPEVIGASVLAFSTVAVKVTFDPVIAVLNDDWRAVIEVIFAWVAASEAAEPLSMVRSSSASRTMRGRRAMTRVPNPEARKVRHQFLVGYQRPVDMNNRRPRSPGNAHPWAPSPTFFGQDRRRHHIVGSILSRSLPQCGSTDALGGA